MINENDSRITILFLCTGNSCRSQMAEGWTNRLKGDVFRAFSAGIERHGVNPRAVSVMKEAGVDISGQTSKTTIELNNMEFDYVITLCDHAAAVCPFYPAKTKVLHHAFDDPAACEKELRTEEEILACFRRVRDEIKVFVEKMPGILE